MRKEMKKINKKENILSQIFLFNLFDLDQIIMTFAYPILQKARKLNSY